MTATQARWLQYAGCELELLEDAYTTCSCTRVRDTRSSNGYSGRSEECPVHRGGARGGMLQAHALLQQLLPTALLLAEVPVMSEGNKGRDAKFQFFTAGADLFVDLMACDDKGRWHAIEVNGPDHRGTRAGKRDRKKRRLLNKWGVPVIVLKWKVKGSLPLDCWCKQLKLKLSL